MWTFKCFKHWKKPQSCPGLYQLWGFPDKKSGAPVHTAGKLWNWDSHSDVSGSRTQTLLAVQSGSGTRSHPELTAVWGCISVGLSICPGATASRHVPPLDRGHTQTECPLLLKQDSISASLPGPPWSSPGKAGRLLMTVVIMESRVVDPGDREAFPRLSLYIHCLLHSGQVISKQLGILNPGVCVHKCVSMWQSVWEPMRWFHRRGYLRQAGQGSVCM